MNESWYEPNRAEEPSLPPPVNNAPTNLRRKRRTGWIVTLCIAAVIVLIAVSSVIFGAKSAAERPAGRPDAPSAEPGEPSSDKLPDSFRDFFSQYYTPFDKKEECTIPRVTEYPKRAMELRPAGSEELSLQAIYEKCAPSVVAITAYVSEKRNDQYYWGTGVILSDDGYIVTNAHVVEGSCRAAVTLWDDREFSALLVGYDDRSDVAVLKIDAAGLTPAEFCDGDALAVGESVVAIGNPLGKQFRSTMTEGIISGIDRDISHNGATLTLLQTSAPINEGNSGGALINRFGQVIGITNMKMSSGYLGGVTIEGVGFAIPSRTVKTMADSLLSQGAVMGRPALGVTVGAVPDTAREEYGLPGGLYVSAVSPTSDAAAEGLQVGDILTEVNGEPLSATEDLVGFIAERSVGDSLTLTVWRQADDGAAETFSVEIRLLDVNDVY